MTSWSRALCQSHAKSVTSSSNFATNPACATTSVLLDRLERAGLLVRSRESADRRRVTLRPTDEGRERVRSFAALAGAELAASTRTTDEHDLDVALGFLSRMNAAVTTATERLHQHAVATLTT